ncbi:expressed unknown protein [Seminavis robusta]|uniref:Uncharacterized protein n=1 Tax=Seminavis robusta TaxID=568900 RepID=A0A9N8HVT1_9STRA|nr:expressed unknown protein [Seminavis robusta]|eukprot:Sro1862_g302270.1 n/a (161) ;mRNA; f:20381-20863
MDPKEFDEMETEEEVETDEEEEQTVKVGNRPFNTRAYVNNFINDIDTTKTQKHTPDAGYDRILQVHDHMLSVQDFEASHDQYGVGSWDSTRQRYMKMTDKKESEFDGQLLAALADRVENPIERQQDLKMWLLGAAAFCTTSQIVEMTCRFPSHWQTCMIC